MLTLKNKSLEVQLLDPAADQARFGTRYCTGGYIFQIVDAAQGDLLSGPTFPESFNTFDGQGIPDAFNLQPLRGPGGDPEALIIGVGLCDLQNDRVSAFCSWTVKQTAEAIQMRTQHTFRGWRMELLREVRLIGRTVRSSTTLVNAGGDAIPVRWFPHPFFPQHGAGSTDELCKFNIDVRFIGNAAYKMLPNGFIARADGPWTGGNYLALTHDATARLSIAQRHPKLGLINAACSYVPDFFPIWGNPRTFSWEPFLERTVASSQSLDWWIDYDF